MEVKFVELKQSHVEKYDLEKPVFDVEHPIVSFGGIVRAAIKAGWLVEPPENVDDMKPGDVRKLAEAIIAEYNRVEEVTPS